jgi:hypothetical protein
MARRSKPLRKTHIDGDIWKWYVRVKTIIIFSPAGKRYEFPGDYRGYFGPISPRDIKSYIIDVLIPKEKTRQI